ncbi:glycine betaine ABC transporter substrate-binding protein [Actinomyces wuliandei]|uniref:glycine betaine ABC transporter substrate-binding protein n=1 Tax=Actinomyces wuliandei TaxID=2057743 RepID=UPI00111B13DA|nr:glycine betaine ABC transporter substrate-binding protein [Actinomyces wuliandei]
MGNRPSNHLTPPGISRRHALAVGSSVLAATGLAACGSSGGSSDGSSSKSLTIGVPAGWDEGIAISNLFKVILTDEGYDVTLSDADVGVAYSSLANGDYDLMLDAWLPTTHESYMDQYGDKVEDFGAWYTNAKLALAVNDSAPITSIAELADSASDFDNRIVGIDAGAGITTQTEESVIPTYGLDTMEFTTSSTSAMLAELKGAMSKGDNIVVTLWSPHWAYSAYEIRDLEDPENAFGDAEQIHALGRQGLSDDMPEIATLFTDFTITDEQLSSLEDLMLNENEGTDNEGSARTWLEDNSDFRDSLSI